MEEVIYLAGGCLWGVEAFVKTLEGVVSTEAGRVNGRTKSLSTAYDGYAECVKTTFDPTILPCEDLFSYFFEIIDPYSLNQQGVDVGEKYRTGIYSEYPEHLEKALCFIAEQEGSDKIVVEVKPVENYIPSALEHQDRLAHFPDDYCHIPKSLLNKYKKS